MREILILLIAIAAIVIVWYVLQQRTRAAEQRRSEESRRTAAKPTGTGRGSMPDMNASSQAKAPEAGTGATARSAGLFQEAAGSAAGLPYERAADEMDELTADLANASRAAERAAEQLANRAAEALEAVQVAAAAHGGAVPGDSTDRCPPSYPVKGRITAKRYHLPAESSYNGLVPDVCFQSAAAAEAAGFSGTGDEAPARGDDLAQGNPIVE
jgi:hypothetical protein